MSVVIHKVLQTHTALCETLRKTKEMGVAGEEVARGETAAVSPQKTQ